MEQESPPSLLRTLARLLFAAGLAMVALYFGDQAAEVTRLPFSTLALRDLLNAGLMAMMAAVFGCWTVLTLFPRRRGPAKEKGGTP
jgi:hypothetical protein